MQSHERKPTTTLFYQDWFDPNNPDYDFANYPFQLERLEARDGPGVDDTEPSAFHHSIEHEIECYEPRGFISTGPIQLQTHYPDPYSGMNSQIEGAERLPTTADPEFVSIKDQGANGIILVEHFLIFQSLALSPAISELGLSVICGSGIPRMTARKLLRRIHREAGVPVYLLVDNDAWGYFIYSVLKRGAIGPHAYFPWAAIENVTFIGIRCRDVSSVELATSTKRPWRHSWSLRLDAMRKYQCFQSTEWQQELMNFENQSYGTNLVDFISAAGGIESFIHSYVAPRV